MYKSQKRWRKAIASLLSVVAIIVGLASEKPVYAEGDVPVWARDAGERAEAVFEAQADLPSSFDLRQSFPNNVTPVRCQSPYSTCWAFGGIAAAETSIAADFNTPVDLSEKHLTWFALHPVTDLDAPPSQAGEGLYVFDEDPKTNPNAAYIASNPIVATSLFSTGVGPVLEEDFPYRGKTGMTAYEYALGHKDDWYADTKKDLLKTYGSEKFLLRVIRESTDFTTIEDYIDSAYQKTVDSLTAGRGLSARRSTTAR